MTAPYLSPRFHAPPEAIAAIGLEVRVGTGRPARYPFAGTEFRIGGAESCDLRLTGAHLPAHICRLVRESAHELSFYRSDPAFPLLAGGRAVGDAPVTLRHGDRVAIGPLDLTVHFAEVHLHPQLERGRPPERRAAIDPELLAARDDLRAECDELRAEAQRLAAQLPDLDTRRDELEAFRAELERVREQLHTQYQERREQLARVQSDVTGASDSLQLRREDFEKEVAARRAELGRREEELASRPPPVAEPAPEPEAWPERLEEVAAREAVAEATFAELAARAADLAGHELALAAREAALAEQTRGLEVRQASLDLESERTEREARDLEAHAQGVATEATRIESLVAELQAREARCAEGEAELAALAERLAAREAELAERERAIDERRSQTDGAREGEFGQRLADLEAREGALERQGAKLREVGRAVAGAKREVHVARESIQAELASHAELLTRAEAGFAELRGQLEPLQAEAEAARDSLSQQAESLRKREEALESAAAEHRLAVAGFRHQVLVWQAEATQRAADDELAAPLAAPPESPPLTELREWYRRRLREVAGPTTGPRPALDAPDPGDRQLADLLRTHQLADDDTVHALLAEAQRVRRPLRAVLLTGGAATLYQLAMIESGNLEALALGRLRVIDRVRVTPREVVYRVSDPAHAEGPNRGIYLLRHLAEAEMDDAVRPDEFRQRFAAAREATHLHLAQVADVLEINGRPAALCEQPAGAPSNDWPAEAAQPGVWVRLLEGAAAGLAAAHRHGLAHGRLSSESFVLTPAGELKVVGVGEPMWLATGMSAALEPPPAADLRALGPVSFGWAQLAQPPGKRRTRGKAFPEPLLNVIRRLESDPETPMADTATGAAPYESAAELLADLSRLASQFPCPPAEWDRVVSHAAATRPDGVRQSA